MTRATARRIASTALLLGLTLPACGPRPAKQGTQGQSYLEDIEAFRASREERLRAEDGWLSVIGLFWLEPGDNAMGSDPASAIPLPADAAPPHAATLSYDGSTVLLESAEGVTITVEGEPAKRRELADDAAGKPDLLRLGRLTFYIIARDGRHAVRLKDPASPLRTGFHGLDYFPIDERYRVQARLRAYDKPREILIPTVLGTATPMLAPGVVEFELNGTPLSLVPTVSRPGDTNLFFIFRDETSGHETYGAGRFLYAELEGQTVQLDFNKAYNPPCVFTPHATCPLPPRQNRLAVRIEAGEKMYGEQH